MDSECGIGIHHHDLLGEGKKDQDKKELNQEKPDSIDVESLDMNDIEDAVNDQLLSQKPEEPEIVDTDMKDDKEPD